MVTMTKNQAITRFFAFLSIIAVTASWTGVSKSEADTSVKPKNYPYFPSEIKNNLPFHTALFADNELHKKQNACSVTTETLNLLKNINVARAKKRKCGQNRAKETPALLPNCGLIQAAKTHADYLASLNELRHKGRQKESLGQRVSMQLVKWRKVSENLAQGTKSTEEVVRLWLDSPSHCRNLMNADYTAIGLARSNDTWVAIFAELTP